MKMKRAVLYTRVSTCDQNPETQALDLRRLAEQRGFEMVHEYTDRIGGAKAKRPALDQMMAAAYRREFDTDLNLISEIRTRALALKRQGRSPDDDGKQVRTSKRSIPTGATPTPLDSSNAPMRNFNRTG
ncbi:MAG: recombinase family protein [Candidatus Sulfotelmatobacter sp.]|jgi:DNA invertase Pin-like site-specific DNA recombinase